MRNDDNGSANGRGRGSQFQRWLSALATTLAGASVTGMILAYGDLRELRAEVRGNVRRLEVLETNSEDREALIRQFMGSLTNIAALRADLDKLENRHERLLDRFNDQNGSRGGRGSISTK